MQPLASSDALPFFQPTYLPMLFRAAGTYFNKVRAYPLEMQPLASSDTLPSFQPTYLPMLFIIPNLMLSPGPTLTHAMLFVLF